MRKPIAERMTRAHAELIVGEGTPSLRKDLTYELKVASSSPAWSPRWIPTGARYSMTSSARARTEGGTVDLSDRKTDRVEGEPRKSIPICRPGPFRLVDAAQGFQCESNERGRFTNGRSIIPRTNSAPISNNRSLYVRTSASR